jgi:uncharacterized protein YuzE
MRVYVDYLGNRVRLTQERLAHILEHREMSGMEPRIAETLRTPESVVESLSDVRGCIRRYGIPHRQGEEGQAAMAAKKVRIWFDREADYLEVLFDQREGFFRETANDQVMEKVDAQGNILGFSVLKVSALTKSPLEVLL